LETFMRRNLVGLVWIIGIALTVIVYQVGPDRIVWESFGWLRDLRVAIDSLFASLAVNTFELMRALTIGLFPVFVVLALVALRRGLPVRSTLIAVTIVFVLLLLAPLRNGEGISDLRWIAAFVVVLGGSISMTRRLTGPAAQAAQWPGQPGHGPTPSGRSPWPTPPR
jgi:hypothetical protein